MGVFKDSWFWQRKSEKEYDISQQDWVVLCQSETKAFQNPSWQGTLFRPSEKDGENQKSCQIHRLYFNYEIKQQPPKLTAMATLLS